MLHQKRNIWTRNSWSALSFQLQQQYWKNRLPAHKQSLFQREGNLFKDVSCFVTGGILFALALAEGEIMPKSWWLKWSCVSIVCVHKTFVNSWKHMFIPCWSRDRSLLLSYFTIVKRHLADQNSHTRLCQACSAVPHGQTEANWLTPCPKASCTLWCRSQVWRCTWLAFAKVPVTIIVKSWNSFQSWNQESSSWGE